ncbi:MAG TPA: hypothetical protein VGR28_06185 [Candidatus Thermoplasmatota archaeon]|nr:hypothetical protein [Candidatus Thermoplasmatota archaeon]
MPPQARFEAGASPCQQAMLPLPLLVLPLINQVICLVHELLFGVPC